jgi:hypothetical protein
VLELRNLYSKLVPRTSKHYYELELVLSNPLFSMLDKDSPGGADHALAVARKCLRLRSEMSHFCTNLQYYIMFEVLEAAWQVRGPGSDIGYDSS